MDIPRRKNRLLRRARQLRTESTDAERRLWYHLRSRRLLGLKFRRQHPMGRYIADFVCLEKRLVVEIDGGQHADSKAYDRRRDAWLEGAGFRVLRFWNHEVMSQLPAVLERIRMEIEDG
jgi:very-short-patch-repair endonuclease